MKKKIINGILMSALLLAGTLFLVRTTLMMRLEVSAQTSRLWMVHLASWTVV